MSVIDIRSAMPHLVVNGKDITHVISVALIKEIIDGSASFDDIDRGDEILKAIVSEWLADLF